MMKGETLIGIVAACWFALPFAVRAQGTARSPTPVRVSVGDVTDNRTTGQFFARCKVQLKFTGDAAADAGSVRQVHVTEALDELGRDLRMPGADVVSTRSLQGRQSSGRALEAEVDLRNPSRNATTIKVLKGEVELFNPTEANGAILRIKDVLKKPAEPVQHSTLEKHGIQLMYLTKEAYEAKRKEAQSGGGLEGAFGEMFQGMFGGMSGNSKNTIQIYLKDPEQLVVGMEYQDARGELLKTTSRWASNEMHSTTLAAAPPEDTQLVLHLAVPEAVTKVPFEVHDIPLP